MAEALTTIRPKPTMIDSPVPGEAEANRFADVVFEDAEEFASASAAQAPEGEVAEPQAQFADVGFAPEEIAPEAAPEFEVEPEQSFSEANLSFEGIKRQIDDIPIRIAQNLAGTQESKKLTLENQLGKENVKQVGQNFLIRKPGEKKFRKVESSTFELINDIFSDNYREAAAGLGAAVGGLIGAPSGPGAVASAALGAATGAAAAQAQGEQQFGVVREEERRDLGTRLIESGTEGASVAAFNKIGEAVTGKIARSFDARKAKKALKEFAPEDLLSDGVRQNLDTLRELDSLGLTTNIPGTNTPVLSHQIVPGIQESDDIAKSLAGSEIFNRAQTVAAKQMNETFIDVIETGAEIEKGRLSSALRSGISTENRAIAPLVKDLFDKVRKQEGAVIGKFRKQVRKEVSGQPLPTQKVRETVSDVLENLNVSAGPEGQLVFPDESELAQLLGTDSKLLIKGLKNDLGKLAKGDLNIDQLLGEVKLIGNKNKAAGRIGGQYKTIIGRLSAALRADSREIMPQLLSPEDAISYNASMGKFAKTAQSMEILGRTLDDDLGNNTFVKSLFNSGKKGLSSLRAAKEFLLAENPELWKKVSGEYLEELALASRVQEPGQHITFKPNKFRNKLLGLGDEYLNELFPKSEGITKERVFKTLDLAEQLSKSIAKGADGDVIRQAQNVIGSLSWYHRGVNAAKMMLSLTNKEGRLAKIMSKEGLEVFLKGVPKKDKGRVRKLLGDAMSSAQNSGLLSGGQRAGTTVLGSAAGQELSGQ